MDQQNIDEDFHNPDHEVDLEEIKSGFVKLSLISEKLIFSTKAKSLKTNLVKKVI